MLPVKKTTRTPTLSHGSAHYSIIYILLPEVVPFELTNKCRLLRRSPSKKKHTKIIILQVFKTTKLDLPGAKKASVRAFERYLLFESVVKRPISSWPLRTREKH